jgi:HSP20 family protein
MALVKYSDLDFRPVTFNSILDNFFNETNSKTGRINKFRPSADVVETDKGYEIEVSLPGIEKNDINIDVNEGTLTISGERKLENEVEGKNYHMVETSYGSFSRSFRIPKLVDSSKIDASYKNGILKVDLPKDEKKALKTSIKVK